jgi:FKBP-type peptidyl-prolyl cis-trans isomerase FkpA
MIKKNFRAIIPLMAVIMMISIVSCDPTDKLANQEKEQIADYLAQNSNLNYVKKPSGLYYLEVLAGTGISPVSPDSAYVRYTLKFIDGTVLYSSVAAGTLYGFIVGENVPGFEEGIALMKVGGKSSLLVPSKLAYGTDGRYPYIPGYTPLLYDIELVKVAPQTGK